MTGRKILEDDVAEFGKDPQKSTALSLKAQVLLGLAAVQSWGVDHVLTQLRCPIEAGVDPED
eukprot:4529672-Amphidinium_carterae.2